MVTPSHEELFARAELVVALGTLALTSGRIVACDPFFCGGARMLDRTVAPGAYEVRLCRVDAGEWGRRVALARIDLAPGAVPAAIVPASVGGEPAAYRVESGIGSFMDENTRIAFADVIATHAREHPESDYYTEVLAAEFRAHADPSDPDDIGSWVLHTLAEPSQTIAMFASGLGDGWYGSYWSLGADGEPVALTTNFALAERL